MVGGHDEERLLAVGSMSAGALENVQVRHGAFETRHRPAGAASSFLVGDGLGILGGSPDGGRW